MSRWFHVASVLTEGVDDEDHIGAGGRQCGSAGLSPIPTTAGDALIVPPDGFTGFGRVVDLFAVAPRQEHLITDRSHQAEWTHVAVDVFSSDGHGL